MNAVSSKKMSGSVSDNRKSAIQNPKWVGIFAIVITFALCAARADAQQPGQVSRIGVLDPSTASGSAVLWETFRQELTKLGWIEGKNTTIEYQFAEQSLSACLSLQRSWFV